MDVLVTGGAGFLGSVLVPALLNEGHKVVVLDNLTWGGQGLRQNFANPNFRLVRGDVREENLVCSLIGGKDVVVHLAAIVGFAACERMKRKATDINVNGTKIINKHLTANQLLIYASTGSIYGSVEGESCSEETAPNPQSLYAATKAQAEKEVFSKSNAVVLRFATAFGVSPRMRFDLLVNQFVYEASKNKALVVYEKDFVRPVIHVKDIARSILFAIQHADSMVTQAFNVGSPELTFTKEQIALHIRRYVDFDLQFANVGHDRDKRNYGFANQKIVALGYRPIVSLDEGIQELIDAVSKLPIDERCFNA